MLRRTLFHIAKGVENDTADHLAARPHITVVQYVTLVTQLLMYPPFMLKMFTLTQAA